MYVIALAAFLIIFLTSCASLTGTIAADIAFRPKKLSSSGARQEAMQADLPEIRDSIAKNNQLIENRINSFLETNSPARWTAESQDKLSLVADFFKNNNSDHKYVLIIHGYLSSKEQMRKFAPFLFDSGYNVVIPDSRAHGESEGIWTSLGTLEARDVQTWVKKIIDYDPKASIAIMGVSCGASAVMIASNAEMPGNVKCIIEDCGFTSIYDEMKYLLKTRVRISGERIIKAAQARLIRKAEFDIMQQSPVKSISETNYPMLFIHGSGDSFVPFSMHSDLLKAYRGPFSDFLIVEGAPHAQSYNTNPEFYEKKINEFLKEFIY